MRKLLLFLLTLYLLIWVPLGFAGELLAALPSMRMRGLPALVEIGSHALVALLAFTAGWTLWQGRAGGRALASAAVVATGVVSVQSVFWTILPRDVPPGTELPVVLVVSARTALWLAVLVFSVPEE